MEFIPIEKELIPYDFSVELGGEEYSLEVRYNEVHKFFTLDLLKNEQLIVTGDKLLYGKKMFEESYSPKTHPPVTLMALDMAGHETTVTWANLGETVFLYLLNSDEAVSANG